MPEAAEEASGQLASLSPSLSRTISSQLFDADEEPEREPLRPQASRVENRERFRRNESNLARTVFQRSNLIILALVVVVAVVATGMYFYIRGWFVWVHYHRKPCDQHLAIWLLMTLLLPVFNCLGLCLPMVLRKLLRLLPLLVLVAGIWMYSQTDTCAKTNPALYYFVKHYLIFLTVIWCCAVTLPLILVAVLLYLMHNGWFDRWNAAKAETIKNVETITYDPSLFAEDGKAGDSRPAGECCVCTEAFCADKTIKRTPCNHCFHEECLGKWLQVSKTCPLCRNDVEEAVMGGGAAA